MIESERSDETGTRMKRKWKQMLSPILQAGLQSPPGHFFFHLSVSDSHEVLFPLPVANSNSSDTLRRWVDFSRKSLDKVSLFW